MSASKINREIAADGSIVLSDSRCKVVFRRLRAGALEIQIAGIDCGQFGTAMIDEIALAMARDGPLELFVDASEAPTTPMSVTDSWTRFFAVNRAKLKRIRILAGSQSLALAMKIVHHLSDTSDLMHIYLERDGYDARKAISR